MQFYLLWSVDIFVKSFEGIDVELHELPQQIKVALQDVPGGAATVYDTEQDVLSRDGSRKGGESREVKHLIMERSERYKL